VEVRDLSGRDRLGAAITPRDNPPRPGNLSMPAA
jgi:hypothetical protein